MKNTKFIVLFMLGLFAFGFAKAQGNKITVTDEGTDSYGLPARFIANTASISYVPYTFTFAGETHDFGSTLLTAPALTTFDISYTYPFYSSTSNFLINKSAVDALPLNTYLTTPIASGGALLKIKRTGLKTYSFKVNQVYL